MQILDKGPLYGKLCPCGCVCLTYPNNKNMQELCHPFHVTGTNGPTDLKGRHNMLFRLTEYL